MVTYLVRTHGWDHGLELDIEGVGMTQTHDAHPDDTPEVMVRDYLATIGRDDAMTAELVFVDEQAEL